jgi:hypothetical protein
MQLYLICDLETPSEPSTAQKKCFMGLDTSTEKSSRKKAKKIGGMTGKIKVSDMLKKFIKELFYRFRRL